METVKKTDTHTIVKKKSGRFGVMDKKGKWVNAQDKVDILTKEKFLTAPKKKAPVEEPTEEVAVEQPASEAEPEVKEPEA